MERLTDGNDLRPFAHGLELQSAVHEVEVREAKYGIRTKYLRTERVASVDRNSEEAPLANQGSGLSLGRSASIAGASNSSGISSGIMDDGIHVGDRDVFLVPDGQKLILYAWLLPSEFETLRRPDGAKVLDLWVASLSVDVKGYDSAHSIHGDENEATLV